jgi:hypothetical protein
MTVVNASVIKKSVADPTSAYVSMRPAWDRARAILGGERYVKDFDSFLDLITFSNILLPFSPSMTPAQYNFFKAEAELPGIIAQYAKIIVGGLLRKQPQLTFKTDVPEDAKDWILNEFSQDSSPLISFLDTALWEEMQTNRAWVYVDYPKVTEKMLEGMSTEDRDALKPFPVLWNAETVINWRVSVNEVTGEQELIQVITRNYEEVYADGAFHPSYLDTVWVHELVGGYYQIRKYQKPTQDAQTLIQNGKIIQDYKYSAAGADPKLTAYALLETNTNIVCNGQRLTFIPAWPLNGSIDIVEPMLTPLVDREVSLYNKVSRRNHLLYGASTYTPVLASDMTDDQFTDVVGGGLGSWIHLRTGDTLTVLDTPTEALADMDRSIVATIDELAKLGIRMLTPETAQSGVALDIRNATQTAQLGTLNVKISNTLASVIAFMVNWRYDLTLRTADVCFELSADFNPAPLGADWLRLATEWYEKKLLPRSAWLQMIKSNDMLAPDYDDAAGRTEMLTDELIATPTADPSYADAIARDAGIDPAVSKMHAAKRQAELDQHALDNPPPPVPSKK